MKRIVCLCAFAGALAAAACGGADTKAPMTPDSDKPADLADAGPATTPPPPPK